jgi:bzd-type benzoyl-CoA reductase Q subunit
MAVATEYWRWTERRYINPNIDWTKAKDITAGIDIGAISAKALVMTDGDIFAYSLTRTGSGGRNRADQAISHALEGTGMKLDNIQYIVGTGYGRINIPFAQTTITEIACHARGANYIWGSTVRTIIDIGGHDIKVIRCDDRGKVIMFLMNDKCAAGTGRGIEVLADLLCIPIEEIGPRSLEIPGEPEPVSSRCVVFAKSEVIGLLDEGMHENETLAAYCAGMVHRIGTQAQRLGVEKDLVITGGIAKNVGIVSRLENELNIQSMPLPEDPKYDPQLAGALGAALFARTLLEKASK